MTEDDERDETYVVVINDEGQYSIWPVDLAVPAGWRDAGKTGSKADCLAYVDQVWTDMRPRSLRERMERERTDGERIEAADGDGSPLAERDAPPPT